MDDLLNHTARDIPGYLQAFAYDLVSLAEGNDLDVIWDRTRKTMNTIVNWCHTKELSISALKTEIFMFTWNRKWSLRPIKVENTTLPLSNSAKFLGVTLNSKLNFNKYLYTYSTSQRKPQPLIQCKRSSWAETKVPKTC